jgi:hypothetical protein
MFYLLISFYTLILCFNQNVILCFKESSINDAVDNDTTQNEIKVNNNKIFNQTSFDALFLKLQIECGPQHRKSCYDDTLQEENSFFCFHLNECNGVIMYPSDCNNCLIENQQSYWCNIDNTNISSICSNDQSICNFFGLEEISNIANCPTISLDSNNNDIHNDIDCNFNNINDILEIRLNNQLDSDYNNIIDSCEVDCNQNGYFDFYDIKSAYSHDLNDNHIPDECDPDCNQNGIPDDIDLLLSNNVNNPEQILNSKECLYPSPSASSLPTPSVSASPSISPSSTASSIPTMSVSPSSSMMPPPSVSPSSSNIPVIVSTTVTPSSSPSQSPDIPTDSKNNIELCISHNGLECNNHGSCNLQRKKCECTKGWIGKKCEYSLCNYQGIYDNYWRQCDCFPGWGGEMCDHCISNPLDNQNKLYICCPSSVDPNVYRLVLIDESKKNEYLKSDHPKNNTANRQCLLQNSVFRNGDKLDCSCNINEPRSKLSYQKIELRKMIYNMTHNSNSNTINNGTMVNYNTKSNSNTENKYINPNLNLLNEILTSNSEQEINDELFNTLTVLTYKSLIESNLNVYYPMELGNAMESTVINYAEDCDCDNDSETTGIIISVIVIIMLLLFTIGIFIYAGLTGSASKWINYSSSSKSKQQRKVKANS